MSGAAIMLVLEKLLITHSASISTKTNKNFQNHDNPSLNPCTDKFSAALLRTRKIPPFSSIKKKTSTATSCSFHHKLQVPTLLDRETRMAKNTQENGVVAGCPVVEVNPQPQQGLASTLIDCLEMLITRLMCDTSQSHPFLSGNFAPVLEETAPVKDIPVEGHLPVCLGITAACIEYNGIVESVDLYKVILPTNDRLLDFQPANFCCKVSSK